MGGFRDFLDQSNLKMAQKGAVMVGVPLLLGLILFVAQFLFLKEIEREKQAEAHSAKVIKMANELGATVIDAVYLLSGYVFTRSELVGDRYDKTVRNLSSEMPPFIQEVSDNPAQLKSAKHMQLIMEQIVTLLNTLRNSSMDGSDPQEVMLLVGTRAHLTSLIKEFLAEQHEFISQGVFNQSPKASAFAHSLQYWQQVLAFGVIVTWIVSLLLAVWILRGVNEGLNRLVDNTKRFAKREPLRPMKKRLDEIGELDVVFHNMAARIEKGVELIKQSEERVRLMVKSMPVGLLIVTPEGYVETVNERTEEMVGYSESELLGKHVATIFADGSNKEEKDFLEQLLQKASERSAELDARRKNGDSLPVEISINRLQMRDGPRLLTTMLDVTERREIERLKQEFVAMISHDLKTPLTSIVGNLALVSANAFGTLNERGKYLVETSEKQGERLINLINDLLFLEKIEAGGFELHATQTDFGDVVQQSIEAVEQTANARSITIEAKRTDVDIFADGTRLVQVLVNLLGNAIKFSPDHGTVKVVVEERDDWLEVKVVDQGRGIPEAYRKSIFEKFKQVEIADALERGGTGLGLPICKLIVEKHGGTIGVTSEEGKGSTFWFRIPKKQSAATTTSISSV
jgi:PAS domain S-box-containing protein